MKMGRTSIGMLSVAITLSLAGLTPCIGAHDDQIPLSFDSIFPATPYKDALGACMQVLGYLDQLCHEHDRGEQMAFTLVHDAFLGKVVAAQHKIGNLLQNISSGETVTDDNIIYLSAVLGHISQLYKERFSQDQRNALASTMIDEMALKVSRVTDAQ